MEPVPPDRGQLHAASTFVEQPVLEIPLMRTIELVDHALLAFLLAAEKEKEEKMDQIEDMILGDAQVSDGRSTVPPREERGRKGSRRKTKLPKAFSSRSSFPLMLSRCVLCSWALRRTEKFA